MTENNELKQKLEALAIQIADDASGPDVGLADRIDAFKALTPYYVNTTKLGVKQDDEEDEGTPNFASFSQRIAAAGGR